MKSEIKIMIIIIEHLFKHISPTVHQRSCRFTLLDMMINIVKFNMMET